MVSFAETASSAGSSAGSACAALALTAGTTLSAVCRCLSSWRTTSCSPATGAQLPPAAGRSARGGDCRWPPPVPEEPDEPQAASSAAASRSEWNELRRACACLSRLLCPVRPVGPRRVSGGRTPARDHATPARQRARQSVAPNRCALVTPESSGGRAHSGHAGRGRLRDSGAGRGRPPAAERQPPRPGGDRPGRAPTARPRSAAPAPATRIGAGDHQAVVLLAEAQVDDRARALPRRPARRARPSPPPARSRCGCRSSPAAAPAAARRGAITWRAAHAHGPGRLAHVGVDLAEADVGVGQDRRDREDRQRDRRRPVAEADRRHREDGQQRQRRDGPADVGQRDDEAAARGRSGPARCRPAGATTAASSTATDARSPGARPAGRGCRAVGAGPVERVVEVDDRAGRSRSRPRRPRPGGEQPLDAGEQQVERPARAARSRARR